MLDKLNVLANRLIVFTISTVEIIVVFAIFCFLLAAFGFV